MAEADPEAPGPEPADLVSGPDSAPEVRGEAGRGEAWLNWLDYCNFLKNLNTEVWVMMGGETTEVDLTSLG